MRQRLSNMTDEEIAEYIRQNPGQKAEAMRLELRVSFRRIAAVKRLYGIGAIKQRTVAFTPEERSWIIENIDVLSINEMANHLGCGWRKVSGTISAYKKYGRKDKIEKNETSHYEQLQARAKELGEKLEHCTVDEYHDLAVEYSVVLGNIEAAELVRSRQARDKETKDSCARIYSTQQYERTTFLNQ